MLMRRIIGAAMLLIGVTGIALSIVGTILSRQLVDDIGAGMETSLTLTAQSLETVEDTLILTRVMIGQVNDGIYTVEETAITLGRTLSETEPLLTQVIQVAARDIPNSLEAVEEALPNVVEVAGSIDSTLRLLSALQVERRILGVPLRFDLGIHYEPTVPFDESVALVGDSLEGMPEQLRSLEDSLETANSNLAGISDNVYALANDLETINQSVAQILPLLDEYQRLIVETGDIVRQTRANIQNQVASAKLILTIIFVWAGLTQAAPIYLGNELLWGRRGKGINDDKQITQDEG